MTAKTRRDAVMALRCAADRAQSEPPQDMALAALNAASPAGTRLRDTPGCDRCGSARPRARRARRPRLRRASRSPAGRGRVCTICGNYENAYCRDEAGVLVPKCRSVDCVEHTSNDHGYCRDCKIERDLASMECSGCGRMRYRERDGSRAVDVAVDFAESIWGRCVCDPRPPTVLELAEAAASAPEVPNG